jgi:hypothetical protein
MTLRMGCKISWFADATRDYAPVSDITVAGSTRSKFETIPVGIPVEAAQ